MPRDGDAIVVRIAVRFHRRKMMLTHGATPDRETNGLLVSALASRPRFQPWLKD